MCFFGGGSGGGGGGTNTTEVVTPAPAPSAPLPAPDAPKIGETRRDENLKNFGTENPQYRVRGSSRDDEEYRVERTGKRPKVGASGNPIRM